MKLVASPSDLGPAGPTTIPLRSPSEISADATGPHASEPRRSRADESPTPASQRPRSQSRRGNLRLAVHSNGTFSLVRDEPQSGVSDTDDSLISPHPSYASRTPSAQDRSLSAWSDRRSSTPLTGASTVVLDQSVCSELPESTPSSRASSSTAHLAEEPVSASPWNYRLVGGLRKVPTTPEKGKQPVYDTSASSSETQLAPLPEAPADVDDQDTPTRTVIPKASFASVISNQTLETVSEATNYKVYGEGSVPPESTDSLVFNSETAANWEVLGPTSPSPPFPTSSPAASDAGNENYVVHGALSVSPSSSLVTIPQKPRAVYSRESLVVAPLRPTRQRSHERLGYYKQRSRENLRSRTGSVQSLRSLSSIITAQDPTHALLTTPVVLKLGASSSQRLPWSVPQRPGSSSSIQGTTVTLRPPVPMLPSTPHQWSSQLSTVMSESDLGSDVTRSVSPLSDAPVHHRRHSSTGLMSSLHSRQMASISSSIAGQLEEAAATSGSDSLERPDLSYGRAGPSHTRMVRDQDEHGDGLADLEHRPSKTGLSALFANGSSRNLHSSNSSRANSFTSQIPAWARVYYGSGERRFLGRRPSFVTISDVDESRPSSAAFARSESPNTDNFPQAIFSPRRRAREVQPALGQQPSADHASVVEVASDSAQQEHDYRVFRTIRQKTSSIWSPHLQTDRRATRYSVWEPPSVSWSADSGMLGRRNAQVVLFTIGFILPLGMSLITPLVHHRSLIHFL